MEREERKEGKEGWKEDEDSSPFNKHFKRRACSKIKVEFYILNGPLATLYLHNKIMSKVKNT